MAEPFVLNRVVFGDARTTLREVPDATFDCCVSSPPYWRLRDYGHPDQLGLEPTPELYVEKLVEVFREVRRTLRSDGTLWLNIGDCFADGGRSGGGTFMTQRGDAAGATHSQLKGWNKAPPGLKPKDLVGIPWRLAFALQADGWWLRSEIIWAKPSPMPESVKDRPTKSHEQVFLLAKSERYFFDNEAIREPAAKGAAGSSFTKGKTAEYGLGRSSQNERAESDTRNARDVWTIAGEPYKGAHFAVMPRELARRCILAGSRPGGAVVDPFLGSGTVAEVAQQHARRWFGSELTEEYGPLIAERTAQSGLIFDR